MIDIVRELHGLVPIVLEHGKEVFDRVCVCWRPENNGERGGSTVFCPQCLQQTQRLEGLFFQLPDWHHENKFLSVSF